jgi:hypothetical protein
VTRPGGCLPAVGPARVDMYEFERLVSEGRATLVPGDDVRQAAALLSEGLRLSHAPPHC